MNRGPESRVVAGVMTGTSIDAMDVAVVRIAGRGLDMRAHLLAQVSVGLGAVGTGLRRAAEQAALTAAEFTALARNFGDVHVEAVDAALHQAGRPPLDLIAVHGQTIFHRPPLSWQLVQPTPLAARFGVPVVSDLRQADLAAGGNGAPITPLADWILFRADAPRAIVNLGGFCNYTALPAADDAAGPSAVRGADVCACNHVLDAVARSRFGCAYDEDGARAARGTPRAPLVAALRAQLRSAPTERSLGTGDEVDAWVRAAPGTPEDIAASAADAIGAHIGDVLAEHAPHAHDVVVAGGGSYHRPLVAALAAHGGRAVQRSDALGVPPEAREAMAMAVLGALAADGHAITLPAVTGCSSPAPCAGQWCFPFGLPSVPLA